MKNYGSGRSVAVQNFNFDKWYVPSWKVTDAVDGQYSINVSVQVAISHERNECCER